MKAATATNGAGAATREQAAAAEAWVREFKEGWRAPVGPEPFAAHFERVLDPGIRLIQPQLPELVGHADFRSGFVAPLFAMIPDVRGEVERWAAHGDTIYIEVTMHGTLGGKPLRFRACDRVTLREGKAIERETYLDPLPLLGSVATRPKAWPRFLRSQALQLRHKLRKRGKR
ncbi:MAG: nuclear transport factor 2 family protein [Actinomycetota bacterium]